MLKFKIIICSFITTVAAWSLAPATPPDTLNFGFAKYIKARERLFYEPVKHVCIRQDSSGVYPAAIVFLDRISFLDKGGRQTGIDALPDTTGIKVTESSQGKYIYVYGAPEEGPGGFHCLYTFDGNTLLKKKADGLVGKDGMGTPLEGPQAFLLGGYGKVTLTKFNGDVIAEQQLLNKELLEDGDIFAVAVPGDSQIFVAANKFKLPVGQATFNRPILYRFDSQLNQVFQDTLEGLLAVSLDASQNGKYLLLAEENVDNSQFWLLDLNGHQVKSFESPKMVVFATDATDLILLSRNAPPNVLSSTDWASIFQPRVATEFPWVDASISGDGTLGSIYNGSAIVLLDIPGKAFKMIDFPYAFEKCQLYDNGQKLIITGEFGYEIYERAR